MDRREREIAKWLRSEAGQGRAKAAARISELASFVAREPGIGISDACRSIAAMVETARCLESAAALIARGKHRREKGGAG